MQPKKFLSRVAALVAGLAAPLAEAAEPAPAVDPAGAPTLLSPFEVRTDKDAGYIATSTLAGSRMNTELRDTPVAISVFTRDFLDDIGKVDVNQVIEYGLNTSSEVGFTGNDFNENNFNFRIRGIGSAQRARNYFKTQLNLDVYNTERIDFARGPNAILFGEASPSGIVNTSTKFARLNQNRQSVQLRVASHDDRRVALDVNRAAGRKFALRANVLWQDAEGYREFEYKKRRRRRSLAPGGRFPKRRFASRARQSTSMRIDPARGRPTMRSPPGKQLAASARAAPRSGVPAASPMSRDCSAATE